MVQGFWIGLAVAAMVLIAAVVGLHVLRRRELAREFGPEHEGVSIDSTQIIDTVAGDWDSVFQDDGRGPAPDDTAVIRMAPVAEPPQRRLRLVRVEDELGSWVPGAHQQEEPMVLGAVFAAGSWSMVKLSDVGLEAS
jgi:hypothetical protein